jgi:hypothetical protein
LQDIRDIFVTSCQSAIYKSHLALRRLCRYASVFRQRAASLISVGAAVLPNCQ